MRKPKVEEPELLAGLMSVLRSKGYDGASLNELAASSGLQKASLYHRFPGGKKEIAAAVLNFVNKWVRKSVYDVLTDHTMTPRLRFDKAIAHIRTIYNNGDSTCIFRALSMDSGLQLFGEELAAGLQTWLTAFERLGKDLGFSDETASNKAIQVLTFIQGSLVVSKGLGNTKPFEMALISSTNLYFEK